MTGPLEGPRSADDLYLAREADIDGVSVLRPVMTGDIFRNVDIPGVDLESGDEERLAIVVSHPCSMRNGARLKDHAQTVRVRKCDPINIEAWAKLYYDRVPLPDLTVVVDPDDISSDEPEAELAIRTEEGAHAAFLECRGRIESCSLKLRDRVACLTEHGVALLHQRMSHNDTRYAPSVDQLIAVCAPVFAEIELWEQWNERLITVEVLDDADVLHNALDKVADEFDVTLSQRRPIPNKRNGFYTLRGDLAIPKRHAAARREILKIVEEKARSGYTPTAAANAQAVS